MAFRDAAFIGAFAALAWIMWGSHIKAILDSVPDEWMDTVLEHKHEFYPELGFMVFVVVFLVNMVIGKRQNQQLALEWTHNLVTPDSPLDKNFTMIGPDVDCSSEILIRESASSYKLHCSGRRNCQGMQIHFRLKPRQDLLGLVLSAAWSNIKDAVEIQVSMNEGTVPPMTLLIGSPAAVKENLDQHKDLATLVRKLEVAKDRINTWPSDRLHVYTEQASIFYDVIGSNTIMEAAFGTDAFAELRPYFRFIHIASEFEEGGPKQTIRLGMFLPSTTSSNNVAVVNKMLSFACLLTDVVASYKMEKEQINKATALRKGAAAKGEAGDEARRRAEERRAVKEAEEKERLKKMTPAQREKELKRKERIERERRLRSMTKK